jgi:integrase
VEEIIAVMRQTAPDRHGARLRALIVVRWRAGLRVQEALALGGRDLDPRRGSLLVRRGKSRRRREIGKEPVGWQQLSPWLPSMASWRWAVVRWARPGGDAASAPHAWMPSKRSDAELVDAAAR